MQGIEADITVAAAITELHRHGVALIAVVRGGGARTDLAAFDSEVIARAIATSPLPVWSGIGHEVDRTIADEVAHRAFKTPTACAAALVEAVRADIAAAEDAWALDLTARRAPPRRRDGRARSHRTARRRRARAPNSTTTRTDSNAMAIVCAPEPGGVTDRADAALDLAARSLGPDTPGATSTEPRVTWAASRRGSGPTIQPERSLGVGASPDGPTAACCDRSADARPGEQIVTTVADGNVHSTIDETSEDAPQ